MAGEFVYVSPEEKAKENQEEVEYFRQAQGAPRSEMEAYLAQERGLANRTYEELAGGKLSVAQQQMQAGLAGTQQALASQAAAGGANPLAARSAAYAGGMAGADVARQTAALRAQEMQAARQMQMGALQRGTEGILSQQQMDMQAAQSAAQKEAAREAQQLAEEQASWGKTKDIAGMASFGLISDPRMKVVYGSDRRAKDVYASDPQMKTIIDYMPSERLPPVVEVPYIEVGNPPQPRPAREPVYEVRPTMFGAGKSMGGAGRAAAPNMEQLMRAVRVPQGGGIYSVATPVAQPTVVEVPNPAWYPGDPGTAEDIEVRGKGGRAPTIMDYVNKGAYGPQRPVKSSGKAAKGAAAGSKTPKGEGSTKGAAYRPLPKGWEKLPPEELDRLLAEFETSRPVYRPDETPPPKYGQQLVTVPKKSWHQVELENAGDMNFATQQDYARAQAAGLYAPARSSRAAIPDPGSENWEQMARRIEAEQRRKYYEQGGPGI